MQMLMCNSHFPQILEVYLFVLGFFKTLQAILGFRLLSLKRQAAFCSLHCVREILWLISHRVWEDQKISLEYVIKMPPGTAFLDENVEVIPTVFLQLATNISRLLLFLFLFLKVSIGREQTLKCHFSLCSFLLCFHGNTVINSVFLSS